MSSFEDPQVEPSDWNRLSLISIAYFTIKFAISFLKNAMQSILPGVAAISIFAENKTLWFSLALPTLILAIAGYSVLYFWHFKFKTHEGEILIHRGVFKKELLNLDFGRIQNINIIRPFYFAPFKVVNCIVESAGSEAAEIELPGVNEAFALETRDKVFAEEKLPGTEFEKDRDSEEISEPLKPFKKLSNREMAKSGLTSYFAFVVFGALAPFYDRIGSFLFEHVYSGLLAPYKAIPFLHAFVATGLIFLTVFLILMALVTGSVVGAMIRFYNYELHDSADRLVRLTGLFERKSTTLKKSKVQSVVVYQSLAARALERVKLQFRQIGISNDANSDSNILIPLLNPNETESFTSIVFPDCPKPAFSNVHPSYQSRVFLYFWVIPTATIVSIISLLIGHFFWIGIILLLPGILLVRMRYRRLGYWFSENYGAIREGTIGTKITIFPLRKTQSASFAQSPGQRKRHLGNLKIQLGSGPTSIPYLPMSKLSEVLDHTLYKTESSAEPWM